LICRSGCRDNLTNQNVSALIDYQAQAAYLTETFKCLLSTTGVFHLEMSYAHHILKTWLREGDAALPLLKQLLMTAGAPPNKVLNPKVDMNHIRTLFTTITRSGPG
jgi:hypothetical protein